MTNGEQMQQIIALMQRQMDTLDTLREENIMLRAANQGPDTNARITPQGKTKRPDRPVI